MKVVAFVYDCLLFYRTNYGVVSYCRPVPSILHVQEVLSIMCCNVCRVEDPGGNSTNSDPILEVELDPDQGKIRILPDNSIALDLFNT